MPLDQNPHPTVIRFGCVDFLMYAYIIGHYNPSVRIIDLVSHTTYVVCVNFIHKWQDLQFKLNSERQIFWETFHGNFIYSQSFCQKSAERKSPMEYFSYFVLISALRLEPWLYACGFSVLQMRQFYLFTYPPRLKWASSEKTIFFAKIGIDLSQYFPTLFKRIHNHIRSTEG